MFGIITPSDLTATIAILTMIGLAAGAAISFYLLTLAKTRKQFYVALALVAFYGSLFAGLLRLWIT